MIRLLCMTLMVLLVGALWVQGAENLLENASFEEEGSSPDRSAGWNWWGDWMNRECGWAPLRDGACMTGYHHWEIENAETSGLYQDLKVEPGKMYTFSVWVNADLGDEDKDPAQKVELRMETPLGDQQATIESQIYQVRYLAQGDEWSRLRIQSVAPREDLRVLIIVHPAGKGARRTGALKFDEASLTAE